MKNDWNSIPDAFVNKPNLARALREVEKYRRWRNVATVFAVSGWAVVVFMLITK